MSDDLKLPQAGELTLPQWQDWLVRYNAVLGERERRIEQLEEQTHYANGVADLAMKHRDYAEQRVEKLEAALREITWIATPDHEDARNKATEIARNALEGKDD